MMISGWSIVSAMVSAAIRTYLQVGLAVHAGRRAHGDEDELGVLRGPPA